MYGDTHLKSFGVSVLPKIIFLQTVSARYEIQKYLLNKNQMKF